ncbi:MAG: hypothetical protein QOF57_503 [Frankiaceae bacterium]|jgi:uncharacterized protein YukE|nr:hypothetical protein [Frankiaceae bacterium]MDQ1727724.1 hypothetical protein [Frankiaceae bacterium]
MAARLRVDTTALCDGAQQVRDCARDIDDAYLALTNTAAGVPYAMAGARTADAWQAITHLVAAVSAEAQQLTQLAAGLTDVAVTVEHRDLHLAGEATALTLPPELV